MQKIDGITERMKRAGIKPHPAKPKYDCPYCNDVGLVSSGAKLGHPLFGRLIPCPTCGSKRTSGGVDEYGLLPADRSLSWQMVMDREPSIANAKKTIQAVLERGYGWVYLYGGYGTAKSTMLRVAVAESLRAGLDATYTRMVDMLDEIRAAYDHNKPQEEATRRIRRWMELPVLALDEIEKTQETGFIVERRFQILDHRYEAATRQRVGVTLIAGNIAPDKLGGALGSRIADGRFTVVHITAVDGRPFMQDGKYA